MDKFEFVWGIVFGFLLGVIVAFFVYRIENSKLQSLCQKKQYDFCKPVQQYEIVIKEEE